jgi:CheY-like chemotaxis protein
VFGSETVDAFTGLTVLVVDPDDAMRDELVRALRRLGLRALGLVVPAEAAELLDGIDADVVLVHAPPSDECYRAVERLRQRTPVVLTEGSVEEVVIAFLRALGRPEAAASLN